MIWYWLIFASLVVLTLCEQFKILSKKALYMFSSIYTILWIFISTIRWNGTLGDWQGYYDVFERYISVNSFSDIFNVEYWFFEPGYYLILRAIKYFTGNYTVLLFFMAIVGIGGFYHSAKYLDTQRNIKNVNYGNTNSSIILVLLVFWCTSCGNIYVVRTNMATAICLYSIRYIEEKNIKKFVLMVWIAFLFHFTSIIFLVAYFVYYMKFNIKKLIGGIIGLMAVNVIGVGRIIHGVATLLGGRFAEKISSDGYQDVGVINYDYSSVPGIMALTKAMANTTLILILILFCYKKVRNDSRFNGLSNLYLVGAALQCVLLTYNMQVARIAIYFIVLQCFLIPYLFIIFKKKQNKLIVFVVIICYMAVKLYALTNSAPGYSNLQTIFGYT